MKVINAESGFLVYQKIFKQQVTNQSKLVAWQASPDSGKRVVADCKLHSFHMESQKLQCELQDSVWFNVELPLFFYLEDGQIIFKTQIQEMKDQFISCGLPQEMKLLDEPEVTMMRGIGVDIPTHWKTKRIQLGPDDLGSSYVRVKSMRERSSRDQDFLNQEFNPTLDEEDKMFADKRESPRARPKVDKWVKVKVDNNDTIHTLKLFDLSRGGMGFITYDVAEFPKGSEVFVVGFDQFDLDDPLIGKIMSHRPVDDSQLEFKIGIKFNEGQG